MYLLIEEAVRELDSRLLMARELVDRNFTVLVGPQWWFFQNFDNLSPGIALFKGNNRIQAGSMAVAKGHGHIVASIEEEVLALCDATEIQWLYDPRVADCCDIVLAQGDFQARSLKTFAARADIEVAITGNPRMDLLRDVNFDPTPVHHDLRNEGRPYVLINTNSSTVNPSVADTLRERDRWIVAGLLDLTDPSSVRKFESYCAWDHQNIENVLRFVEAYRQRGLNPSLVLRPHPQENLEFWQELYEGDPLVSVVREGHHLSWTQSAECLVHTSCTTGLEAFILGRPAVSLRSMAPDWDARMVSNMVSKVADNAEVAVDLVARALDGDFMDELERLRFENRLAEHHLVGDVSGGAAGRIADVFECASGRLSAQSDCSIPDRSIFNRARFRPLSISERQADKAMIEASDLSRIVREFEGPNHLEIAEICDSVFVLSRAVQ